MSLSKWRLRSLVKVLNFNEKRLHWASAVCALDHYLNFPQNCWKVFMVWYRFVNTTWNTYIFNIYIIHITLLKCCSTMQSCKNMKLIKSCSLTPLQSISSYALVLKSWYISRAVIFLWNRIWDFAYFILFYVVVSMS